MRRSRKPFRAVPSDEGSNPSPSAREAENRLHKRFLGSLAWHERSSSASTRRARRGESGRRQGAPSSPAPLEQRPGLHVGAQPDRAAAGVTKGSPASGLPTRPCESTTGLTPLSRG